MEQSKGGVPGLLAVRIVAVDMKARPQDEEEHVFLSPKAFARITTLSNGQASVVTTSDYAEWGTAKPVLMPICTRAATAVDGGGGCNFDADIRLRVSLWERRTVGSSEEESKVMLHADAEVTLPALGCLGTSEQQAVEKAVPLERHGYEIGTLTLRAWEFSPEKHQRVSPNSDDGGVLLEHVNDLNTAGLDSNAAIMDGDESDGDDNLFYELSHSSGSGSSTWTSLTISGSVQSSGEVSTVFGPIVSGTDTEVVDDGERRQVPQQQRLSGDQRELDASRGDSNQPRAIEGLVEAGNTEDKRHLAAAAQAAKRVSVEGGADRGTMSTSSFDGGHHSEGKQISRNPQLRQDETKKRRSSAIDPEPAGEARDDPSPNQPMERDPLTVDIATIMLALTPSYPPGSAEIRVRVRSIVFPARHAPVIPPYMRVSLHPGAHIIVRTGLPSAATTPLCTNRAELSKEDKRDGVLLTRAFLADNIVEYRFGAKVGSTKRTPSVLALPVGSDIVGVTSAVNSAPSPPTIRLEIVSGRSLGHCDLALPEVLRRPGKSFRRLQVPIWKKKNPGGQGKRNGVEKQEQAIPRERDYVQNQALAGQIEFDLGVVLTGQPEGPQPGTKVGTVQLASGVVTVEALAMRTRDVEGGRVGSEVSQRATGVIGVSATLSLGGETKVATIVRGNHDWKEVEKCGPWCPPTMKSSAADKCRLQSICTQLDVLTLRLTYRQPSESSNDCGLDIEHKREGRARRRETFLSVAVSDINDVFDGRWRWVAMRRYGSGGDAAGQNRGHRSEQAGEVGHGYACANIAAEGRLEVQLRVRLSDQVSISKQEHCGTDTLQKSVVSKTTQSVVKRLAESGAGDTDFSALQAWVESPINRCGQARTIIPPLETHGDLRLRDGKIGGSHPIEDPGPGVFELEVLAIHGRGPEEWPARAFDATCNSMGDCNASSVHFSLPWWVRITCAHEAEEGTNKTVVEDSSAGKLSWREEGGDWRPAENACASPSSQQKEGERCGCGIRWIVSWPHGSRAFARCRVHWTASQSVLPVIYLEVFRGQTLVARSVLELPPLISREEPLAFTFPCLRVWKGDTNVPATARSSGDSDDDFVLDLRCSFSGTPSGEKRVTPHLSVETPSTVRTRAPGNSERSSLRGGLLCIQVVAIRRLHRELRSALVLPCSVVFTLPQHSKRNYSPAGGINGFEDGGGWQTRSYAGEGEFAVFVVQPQQGGSVMVLATLLEGSADKERGLRCDSTCGQDRDRSHGRRRILGSTWFPVRPGVMARGHLEDGWYPFRLVGRDRHGASKACDIRLRIHFLPGLQHPAQGLTIDGSSSGEQQAKGDQANASFLTIVLEEGRDLTHQNLQVGPAELFAEVSVEAQVSGGGREAACNRSCTRARQSPVVVGPLPLRDGVHNPRRGRSSHAEPVKLGKGSSPSWQCVLRVPLPEALADGSWRSNEPCGGPDATPRDERRPREARPPRALLSVSVKSTAKRVVTRHPPEVPRSLLSSCSNGEVDLSGERIVERCLLLGTARIRLPSHLLSENGGAAIRGWYAIKDEASGEHRGKVRLSIFPVGNSGIDNSTTFARDENGRHADDNAKKTRERSHAETNPGLDSPYGNCSCQPWSEGVPAQHDRRRSTPVRRENSGTDETEKSEEMNEVESSLRRAGGWDGPEGLQGCGLLFVSIGDLVLRTFGDGVEERSDAVRRSTHLTGGAISLQHSPDGSKRRGQECGTSLSVGVDGGLAAVLAVDRPSGPVDFLALDVQVYVSTPHQTQSTAYHGVVPLTSCFSNAGIAIQEEKGLKEMVVEKHVQRKPGSIEECIRTEDRGKIGPKTAKTGKRRSFGHSYDDESSDKTEASSSEGDFRSKYAAVEGAGRKRPKTRGCCTVNVTTTFVPHARGELEVRLSELHFIPPSLPELERWRSLQELRRRTDPETVGAKIPRVQETAPNVATATTTAFLRVRVLPSGPWGFSRTFPLQIPRSADWVKNPSSAGTIHLPEETLVTLEVDTSVHTISREGPSTPSASRPPPTAGDAASSRYQADIEALMLEVWLFDNDGGPPSLSRSTSTMSSSSSCLLGCGTVALNPAFVLEGRGNPVRREEQEGRTRSSTREQEGDMSVQRIRRQSRPATSSDVVLFGPASGEGLASLTVRTEFSPHHTSSDGYVPPSTSPATDGIKIGGCEWLQEISDLSVGVWAMKSVFYGLDPDNTGFVRLEDILIGAARDRWLERALTPTGFLGNAKKFDKGVRLRAATRGEAGSNGACTTMMTGLRESGIDGGGAHHRVGADGDTDRDGGSCDLDLVHFVRHLLVPLASLLKDGHGSDYGLVSWGVWAALSEVIVQRMMRPCQSGRRRTIPPITSASVWQRAEELGCNERKTSRHSPGAFIRRSNSRTRTHASACTKGQKCDQRQPHIQHSHSHSVARLPVRSEIDRREAARNTLTTNMSQSRTTMRTMGPCAAKTNSRGGFTGSYSTGHIGNRPAASSSGGCGRSSVGYGDLSTHEYPVADESSTDGNGVLSRAFGGSASRGCSHRTVPGPAPVRTSRTPGPQTEGLPHEGLRQTLATSRRTWRSKSVQQRERRRFRQGRSKTSDDERTKKLSVSASADLILGRRPYSASAAPVGARSASRDRRDLASSLPYTGKRPFSERHGSDDMPSETIQTYRAGGVPRSDGSDSPLLAAPPWVGAREIGASAYGVPGEVGTRGEAPKAFKLDIPEMAKREAALRELEKGHFRTETASAKRKAFKFRTCMLEAKGALDKAQQRVLTLENRALEAEGQLLQRDRVRIHEAARARTRILELEIKNHRRSEMMASRKERARAEAEAATILQRAAKGLLRRCRLKAEMLSIRNLQRGGRCMLLARRRYHCRVRRAKAASLFQSVWRGRSVRKEQAARQVRVTLAQAVVRGYLQREKVSDELRLHLRLRTDAAKVMQKNRRRCQSQRAYLLLRLASVMVQSAFRGRCARLIFLERRLAVRLLQRAARRFSLKILRGKAANLIRNVYRLRTRIARCRKERRRLIASAGVLQRAARGFVARRVVQRKREARRRNNAAARLQRAISAYVCRVRDHRRKVEAKLTLLKYMTGVSVKLSRIRRRREASAAVKIQRRVQSSARRKFEAASKIQALWRGHMSRARTRTSQHQLESSAIILQRTWRKSRKTGSKTHTQDRLISTTNNVLGRRLTLKTSSPDTQHASGRARLQSAVEALANGMSRPGVLTPIGAKELSESLARREDDATREDTLRQRLSGLEAALNTPIEGVVSSGKIPLKSPRSAAGDEGGVKEGLLQALEVLENGLTATRPLE